MWMRQAKTKTFCVFGALKASRIARVLLSCQGELAIFFRGFCDFVHVDFMVNAYGSGTLSNLQLDFYACFHCELIPDIKF